MIYFRILVSFICFSFYSSLIYSENLNTDEVIVYSNKFYTTERNSSHHSEIYDHKDIINSGYTNLFDFLSNKSSLNITSYSGNKGAPLIDMRGYGLESGYQNIVINIDGYRMNSIDSSSSFIGTLSTNDIDRIEILKGSGSVVHGDGSNAGSINIYTKNHKKSRISSAFGNFGGKKHSFSTGEKFEKFDVSFSSNYESNDGFSKRHLDGNKDKSKSSNQSLKIKVNPNDYSQVNFKYLNNESNALFPGYLTRQQFKRDPSQRPTYGGYGGGYDEFDYNDDLWSLDYITHLSDNLSLKAYHQGEHKKYAPRDYTPNNLYITKANVNGLELDYSQDTFTITSGISVDERERTVYSSTSNLNVNQIKKQRDSIFFQVNHYLDQPKKLSLNYGARSEKQITKINNQNIDKDDSDRLSMFEVGLNYLANEKINIFTNYTKSMQSQDIDRIFPYRFSSSASNKYDSFNSFIKPMDVRTINFGVNYNDGIQKIKQSIFYSDIDNEIVFNPNNTSFDTYGTNENIDRTRKYGYEIFVYRKINNLLDLKFNYSYTRAQIINDTSSTFPSGKNLPGVPKNSVNFSINFTKDNFLASLNHFWRDRSFVLNDFDNNSSQLAPSFESTDLYLKYKLPIENIYLSSINLFANVNNIFKQKNGIQSYDDTIYPFNFRRTWFTGMEIEL